MRQYAVVGAVAAGVVLADQLTKGVVRQALAVHESVPVIPGCFSLTHVKNTGGAFSLLAGAHESWRVPFFLGVALLAIGFLLVLVRRVGPRQWGMLLALGGVLGGAVGNMIDRALFGEVTDFFDVYWRDWHWPTFNVADACITVGMIVLVARSFVEPADDGSTRGRESRERADPHAATPPG